MSTQNRIVIAVFVSIALLFTAAAVNGPDGGDADAIRDPGGLLAWFGDTFATTPDAELGDLSAPCLEGDQLTVEDGTCTLQVAAADAERRNLRLRADDDVAVQARPPGQDTLARNDAEAGDTITVTVDADGADVDLICAGERTCVLTVLRKE